MDDFALDADPGPVFPVFDVIEAYQAFTPCWPVMLDFYLPENHAEENRTLADYLASFAAFAT